jgi:hypothetical protein
MNQQGVLLFSAVSILVTTTASPDCLVTIPTNSPVDLPAPSNMGWYGSDALAVLIRSDGSWTSKDQGAIIATSFGSGGVAMMRRQS